MDNTEINDAQKLKELIDAGSFDRLLVKVQGKLSKSLFDTDDHETKKRNDAYFTYKCLQKLRDEVFSLVNQYNTYIQQAGK